MSRPHPLLLLPASGALLCFATAHGDYLLPALALTSWLLAALTGWVAPPPRVLLTRQGVGLWIFGVTSALLYDALVLDFEAGLRPVARAFTAAAHALTLAGILTIALLTWCLHVRDRAPVHLARVIALAGILVVTAGNYYGLGRAWAAGGLTFALGAILATATTLPKGRIPRRALLLVLCAAPVIALTAVAAVATRAVVHGALTFRGDFLAELLPAYDGYLGAGRGLTIARDRRISLLDTLLATATGATAPGYLRTQVLTEYRDGRWRATAVDGSELASTAPDAAGFRWSEIVKPGRDDAASTERTVELLVDLGGTVPLPYGARRIASDGAAGFHPAEGGLLRATPSGELSRYRLSEAAGNGAGLESGLEVSNASAIPAEVRDALRPIALAIVGRDHGDPIAAADRLAEHLRTNHTYSYTVRLADAGDPVVDFVTHRRAGWCEHFASALTLLLRSLGHEARLVGGFHVDERHPFLDLWTMRQRDAHAWTEVLDPRSHTWRWVDATPPGGNDSEDVNTMTGVVRAVREIARLVWRKVVEVIARSDLGVRIAAAGAAGLAWVASHREAAIGLGGVVVLTLFAARRPLLALRRRFAARRRREPSGAELTATARAAAAAFARRGARLSALGVEARPTDTVTDIAARLRPPADAAFRAWAVVYERARFDPSAGPELSVALARLTDDQG